MGGGGIVYARGRSRLKPVEKTGHSVSSLPLEHAGIESCPPI